jgi:hypothetical protein
MLDSLEDAWSWFRDTRSLLKLQRRFAIYWDDLPWDGPLGKEDSFQLYTGTDLRRKSHFSLSLLDDLAIVVLFSVFESRVRQYVLREIALEEGTIKHRAIKYAVTEAKERIEFGSFFRVLEPFKDHHHDLVAQVDQIRDYRNWVAHGRPGSPKNNVDPEIAYARLRRFLQVMEGQPE